MEPQYIIFIIISIVIFVFRFIAKSNKDKRDRKVTKTPPPARKSYQDKDQIFNELNERLARLQQGQSPGNQQRQVPQRQEQEGRQAQVARQAQVGRQVQVERQVQKERQAQPVDRFASNRYTEHQDQRTKTPPPAPRHQNMPASPFLETEIQRARQSHYSEESLKAEYTRLQAKGKPIQHHGGHLAEDLSKAGLDVYEGLSAEDQERKDQHEKSRVLKSLIGSPKDLKRAIILKEIFDTKY